MNKPISTLLIAVCVMAWASAAFAEVKVAAVLGDNMVLQRGRPVPVWGWADPGEKVTVEFGGQTKTATAAADGTWRVDLEPFTASTEPT